MCNQNDTNRQIRKSEKKDNFPLSISPMTRGLE